jgi:hypothetical protein
MKLKVSTAVKIEIVVFWFISLEVEAICFSEALVTTYMIMCRYNPEEHFPQWSVLMTELHSTYLSHRLGY